MKRGIAFLLVLLLCLGTVLTALYAGYTLLAGEKQLNASLKSLPEEKRAFLRERIQWLQDLRGLDRKIPME